jgi:oligopeptidase A
MNNPLLEQNTLPAFSQIKPEHILPALKQVLAENRQIITKILAITDGYSWDNFIIPLMQTDERLDKLWSPIGHLHGVQDSAELRPIYTEALALLTEYNTELGQNIDLYQAYKFIMDSEDFSHWSPERKRIVENSLKNFHLAGVNLPPLEKNRCKEIMHQLSELGTKFAQNVLDATQAWTKLIQDKHQLTGLPDSAYELLAQNAEQKQQIGWLIGLDMPSYHAVMTYADDRNLRQELYQAFVTRASEQSIYPQYDNSAIMQQIMQLRQELAKLLGFANYAELSLYQKMAESTQEVVDFLHHLAQKSKPYAIAELAEIKQYALELHNITDFAVADLWYYAEKLRQHKYDIAQEQLRPYFPLPQVMQGLFEIVQRLYGIKIKPKYEVELWHSDVSFYEIYDEQDNLRGQFYLDPYARQGKRGGAWMDECLIRQNFAGKIQYPVAYLVCNFTPPVGNKPSLLTHNEITTLFHEFGHGLQHLLTIIDYPPIAGIRGVEWDAVELPSQFMENWCWEKQSLDLCAKHYISADKLPDDLFHKLRSAKQFQAGLLMLRQLEFALFDFRLHQEYEPGYDIQALIEQVRQQIAVLLPPDFNRFQHSFTHIFAGGYAAGYYSYKWAEVLAADAFSVFEQDGIFNRDNGQAFMQNILELGGSQPAMDLFIAFRGRKPSIEPLLKQFADSELE